MAVGTYSADKALSVNDRFLQAVLREFLVSGITLKEILQPLASRSCLLSRRCHLASDDIALFGHVFL